MGQTLTLSSEDGTNVEVRELLSLVRVIIRSTNDLTECVRNVEEALRERGIILICRSDSATSVSFRTVSCADKIAEALNEKKGCYDANMDGYAPNPEYYGP